MEVQAQDLIDMLKNQRNAAFDEAAILAAQVKDLQAKMKAKDEQIAKMAETLGGAKDDLPKE